MSEKISFIESDKEKLVMMLRGRQDKLLKELHQLGLRIAKDVAEADTTMRNNHLADNFIPTDNVVTDHLIKNLKKRIDKIDAAVERVYTDNYGYCKECEIPIPIGRLELNPSADKCTSCKADEDEVNTIHKQGSPMRLDKIKDSATYACFLY